MNYGVVGRSLVFHELQHLVINPFLTSDQDIKLFGAILELLRMALNSSVSVQRVQQPVLSIECFVLFEQILVDIVVRSAEFIDVRPVRSGAWYLNFVACSKRVHPEALFGEESVRFHASIHVARAYHGYSQVADCSHFEADHPELCYLPRMATVVHKNALKSLSNGNGIGHHPMQTLNAFDSMIPQTQYENHELTGEVIINEQVDLLEQSGTTVENNDEMQQEAEAEPEVDIVINNVVCSFSVRCHLNLREIALNGTNVEYRKENGMITMKLRRPYTTASIWSSGKITCTGATSEDSAKLAARKFARCLQKLGFNVKFNNYRVVNVLGTCSMPFAIRINSFSQQHREADYEPELHPGVTYKLQNPRATLKIFSTGSVTVTAPSVADVQAAIEYIYPLIYEFRKERSKEELEALAKKKQKQDLYSDPDPTLATLATDDIKEQMDTDDENWGD
ncbi:hypothetical protein HUJ05_004187 [Dendroctonus ponderosae]|nr:hypothetical protein HUJ05_004187 [Dendroctonus ponderosae]